MYNKVDTSLNFEQREKDILAFWKENKIFEQSSEINSGTEKVFSFYDGPPTANGKPHIGHILTRVMKDIIPRYKTMKGFSVDRKAGWDTHGLPVELEVEKLLGINGKDQIESYGIEPFIKQCKESVWKYQSEWEKMSDRVGYWVDMENPYVTYDDNYIESVWWAIKTIADKGLLYKGHKIVPYCPRCGTALSSHEVAQGYKDVKEKSVFAKFLCKTIENTSFLAWTTTPWTLPSNVALCVNPNESYVKIAVDGEFFILAEALVSSLFEEGTFEITEKYIGTDLEKLEYEPLYKFTETKEKAHYITCDTYVTLTDGTGIVHIAPAFGEDDAKVGRKYGLPFVQLVNTAGCFVAEATPFVGVFAKDADPMIIEDLKNRGLLFKDMMYEHSYPHCWRCDTPLLYYARSSWFIEMTKVKDQLLASNASVNWMPPTIGTGRMGNFLENVIDWGLSRERYWGTPLPVWTCDTCNHVHVIGSKAELKELCEIEGEIELHRPYIDAPTFKCPCGCGGTMHRVKEVIDCWFDSGSMPFAQFHYPFENKEIFEKNFPADFISEAVDQTRGWFYTLLAISTLLFEKAPFKNCIVLGHVNDKDGIKMSKHKGNVVDPWTVLDKQGADAVRWYFYSSSAPWLPSRFSEENVSEGQRKFMGTLWNTYAFFVLYANIDKYDPSKYSIDNVKLTLMDKWVLSNLNSLVKFVDEGLDKYEITETSRKIQEFTDKLSNWYVRRSRTRFWGSEMDDDKISAYTTLYHVLTTVAKISAPFTPYIAESIYQNLVKNFYPEAPQSVHLCSFPVCDETAIDVELEKGMDDVLDIVILGRGARNSSNMKNRQPLSKVYVKSESEINLDKELIDVILEELNIKDYEYTADDSAFVTYDLKPQLRTLGRKYGKLINGIREHLAVADGRAVVETVADGGVYSFEVNGEKVELLEEDILATAKNMEGFEVATDRGLTVILDTNLTEKLKEEGLAREIVSKIQTMRKEAGFEVTDRINLTVNGGEKVAHVMAKLGDSICEDVLGSVATVEDGVSKEWNLNGEMATITIKQVK
ncbi:MAG: isoleucine--tRNA ligase [Bacillota bacterium]